MAHTHEVPNHLNVEDTLVLGLTPDRWPPAAGHVRQGSPVRRGRLMASPSPGRRSDRPAEREQAASYSHRAASE